MAKKERSKRLHLGKMVVLTFLTLGFYWVYVAYNSLKFLDEYSEDNDNNRWLVILLIIPFVNFIVAYIITRRVDKVIGNGTKGVLLAVMIINMQMNRFIEFLEVQGLGFWARTILGLGITVSAVAWLLTIYQKKINTFLEKNERRRRYSIIYPGEIIFTLVGMFFVLVFHLAVGLMML